MNFPDKQKTWLLAALFVLINGIVFYNALFHNPRTGYDADAHIMYMGTSRGQLPNREQTYEYFSPPLPYVIPGRSPFAILAVTLFANGSRIIDKSSHSSANGCFLLA
ncbi:MAG: hypothetical protein R3E31_05415 [Chloroflexota bacterium]